ncbi:MAG: hypothetical protein ACRD1Z_09375, partial [Vicinamibacteria bacterium]
GYTDLISEMGGLASELDGLSREYIRLGSHYAHLGDLDVTLDGFFKRIFKGIGKFFKRVAKGISKVATRIWKVVKSPAFLSVLGVVANIIPGVGQYASAALLATAKVRQMQLQQASVKKAQQAAQQGATAEEEKAFADYYAKYGAQFLAPAGYTPEVWQKLSLADKRKVSEEAAQGKLQPVGMTQAQKDEAAKSLAMSLAMKQKYGGGSLDPSAFPPDVQQQAQQLLPEYVRQIEAVGEEKFMAAAKKAAGQGSAINSFASGAGAQLPGGMSEVFSRYTDQDAIKAGQQDIVNSGSAVGKKELTEQVIQQGQPGIPFTTIALGIGALAVAGGIVYVVTRR